MYNCIKMYAPPRVHEHQTYPRPPLFDMRSKESWKMEVSWDCGHALDNSCITLNWPTALGSRSVLILLCRLSSLPPFGKGERSGSWSRSWSDTQKPSSTKDLALYAHLWPCSMTCKKNSGAQVLWRLRIGKLWASHEEDWSRSGLVQG